MENRIRKVLNYVIRSFEYLAVIICVPGYYHIFNVLSEAIKSKSITVKSILIAIIGMYIGFTIFSFLFVGIGSSYEKVFRNIKKIATYESKLFCILIGYAGTYEMTSNILKVILDPILPVIALAVILVMKGVIYYDELILSKKENKNVITNMKFL